MAEPNNSTREIFKSIRPKDDDQEVEDRIEDEEPQDEHDEESKDESSAASYDDRDDSSSDKDKAKDDEPKSDKSTKSPSDYYFERRRQKASREYDLVLQENRRLNSRLEELQRRVDQGLSNLGTPETKKEEANPHNKDEDPVKHSAWEAERNQRQIEQLKAQIAKDEDKARREAEEKQREQLIADYASKVDQQLNETFREVPEFRRMFSEMNQGLINLYTAQGMPARKAGREASLTLLNIAYNGEQQGLAPDEALYRQALAFGIRAEAPAPAAKEPPAKGSTEALDAARKKKAPTSINKVAGGRGRSSTSLESLAQTRDKDWNPDVRSNFWAMMRDKAGAR